MPLQATSGAASYDAFGGGVAAVPQYIEDVFSTYLYSGTSGARSISNGLDLNTKGGLVWMKERGFTNNNILQDTSVGITNCLISNTTGNVSATSSQSITSFNTDGFSLGTNASVNSSGSTYVSWAFRKQPKFFDVVSYTGTGSARTIAHSLNGEVGCIIVKRLNLGTSNWQVYHRGLSSAANSIQLNLINAEAAATSVWNSTAPTSTVFSVGSSAEVNASGSSYIAYIFAHNAGGFGLTGTDNVISCGTYTTDSSANATITLGYEPQWVMIKRSDSTGSWTMLDSMRYWTADGYNPLFANSSSGEFGVSSGLRVTSTGFTSNAASPALSTHIYIAIRRGPMKVPTDATKVFGLSARSGTGANATVTGGQTDDAVLVKNRGSAVASLFSSRLTGTGYLVTSVTDAEVAAGTTILQANPWDVMDGVKLGTTSTITNASGSTYINYLFKRAPSFMDVVCYTGNGTAGRTINHNLGVVPEMMIVKSRSGAYSWQIYTATRGPTEVMTFTSDPSSASSFPWNDTAPTSTVFTVGGVNGTNSTLLATYVAYLFATCAGVSKVGSYTGNGSSQTIACGFTAGARFILIKRTDSTGDWYVWDTARGIVAGNDPHLSLNTTAAEVTTDDTIDTDNSGFVVNQVAATNVNVTSATYIFLAIA